MKLHVQLDILNGGEVETVAFSFGTDTLDAMTPAQRADFDAQIRACLTDLAEAGVTDPATALAAEVTRRIADARAYKREAARRGVLPL